MTIAPTTVRWKVNNNPASLDTFERRYLSDLIGEKIGFDAPNASTQVSPKQQPVPSPRASSLDLKIDPYSEKFQTSPNHSGRITPKFIVLHDSHGSHDGTRSWILQSRSNVSYHYLIDSNGNRTQFVGDTKRAWHAGKSYWKGITGLNSCSIGISFWGDTSKRTPSFEEIDSCARKCIYLMRKFGIPRSGIITHHMIAPKRKTDTAVGTYQQVLSRIDELLNTV